MRILVVNTGSSSLKLQLLASRRGEEHQTVAEAHVESWDGRDASPIGQVLQQAGPVEAIGHRVVHGGTRHSAAVLLDRAAIQELRELTPLAPLHQGRALAGISAARVAAPDVPHVACFDTAYHATVPEAARTYALPAEWRRRWPLRRCGFHGLSHAYAARRANQLVQEGNRAAPGSGLRVVSCHLGAGASLCASLDGRSVDTTMGFTPLEGLVMATRSGSVDPGLVLWLTTEAGLTPDEVRAGLELSGGLVGLAGTSDMREVVSRRQEGDSGARLAFDVYVHVLCRHVAAMTAALGGLDALVFTGGVGENAPEVRSSAASRLGHLGIAVHPERNTEAVSSGDRDITDHDHGPTSVTSLVIRAREDLEIARQTQELLLT